jgi:hypothetical protein
MIKTKSDNDYLFGVFCSVLFCVSLRMRMMMFLANSKIKNGGWALNCKLILIQVDTFSLSIYTQTKHDEYIILNTIIIAHRYTIMVFESYKAKPYWSWSWSCLGGESWVVRSEKAWVGEGVQWDETLKMLIMVKEGCFAISKEFLF